jgi:hypothetical protein
VEGRLAEAEFLNPCILFLDLRSFGENAKRNSARDRRGLVLPWQHGSVPSPLAEQARRAHKAANKKEESKKFEVKKSGTDLFSADGAWLQKQRA